MESKLSAAQVIDIAKIPPTGKVIFGGTVASLELETGETVRDRIVGEDEADPKAGSISFVSPVAKSLMGKAVGDVVGASGQELEIVAIA